MKKLKYSIYFLVFLTAVSVSSTSEASSRREKVEKSLYAIAYDSDFLSQQKNSDVILDNPRISAPLLKDILMQKTVQGKGLINSWRLFQYMLKNKLYKINIFEVEKLASIHSQDFIFLTELFLYSYPDFPYMLDPIIKKWLKSTSVDAFAASFKIILQLKLDRFNKIIIDIASKTKNKIFIEGALRVLSEFKIKKPSQLVPLIKHFESSTTAIRRLSVRLFQQYPSLRVPLMKKLKKMDNIVSASFIITTLCSYQFPNKNIFFIDSMKKNWGFITEISLYLQKSSLSNKDTLKLVHLLYKSVDFVIKNTSLDILLHAHILPLNKSSKKKIKTLFSKILHSKKELQIVKTALLTVIHSQKEFHYMKNISSNI